MILKSGSVPACTPSTDARSMKIVFYSTNASRFEGTSFRIRTIPARKTAWEAVAALYPQDEICIVTQLPASFVADIEENHIAEK